MKAMRSRSCSLRFFSRCSCSRSDAGDGLQGGDRCIQVTMFLLQAHELCLELTVVFVGHRVASI